MSLKIKNLSIRNGNQWILRDIDIEAHAGKIFGICGASGSGKTALLKAIAGKSKISSGQIVHFGSDVTQDTRSRGFDLLTADETGIAPLLNAYRSRGSAGEIQRSRFEAFMGSAGSVILLDEPFCSVDPLTAAELSQTIKSWAKNGHIAIISSSSFEFLAPLADEVLLIGNGYAKQTGSPKDLYEHPNSELAARLTGETNLIRARRLSSSDVALPEFQTLDGDLRIFSQPTPKNRLAPLHKDCTLSIRPEQVTISMGASFPEDNLLKAIVTDITFQGVTTLISFDAAGLYLRSRVFKIVDLPLGTECMLGLPPDRIVVLNS